MVNKSLAAKHKIESLDDRYHKLQEGMNDLKRKSAQAKLDKKELARDLATYESNFSERYVLRPSLLSMLTGVGGIRKKMQMSGKYNADGDWVFTEGSELGTQEEPEGRVGILKNSEIN